MKASERARDVVRQLHLWIGVALCLPLVALGITGSVLVFEDELRGLLMGSATGPVAASGGTHSIENILAAARAAAPADYVPASYLAPGEAGDPATVRLLPPGRASASEALRVAVDPATLKATPENSPDLLDQIGFLHTTLLKNREGRQWVGYLGIVMLVLGLTGLVNWWPRRRQWRAAFTVGHNARGYRLYRELHGAAGIWGLLVFVVVSFGGVQLAFPQSVRALVDPLLPARDLRGAANAVRIEPVKGAAPMSLDEAVALVRAQHPDTRLRFVGLPAKPEQAIRVALLREGQDKRVPLLSSFVDPWKRRIVEVQDPRGFTAGEALLAWQHALHAGQGWGPVWRFLVFLSGFLPLLFAITGVTMWLKRRRRGGDPAPKPNPVLESGYTDRRAAE